MQKLEWETKKVKVKDLVQLEINPRKITVEKKQKLIESLEKFNLAEIPAVNTDMTIIGGNQRVTALMLLDRGEEEIDVRMPNRELTPKEVKEYAIISNTHAGEFDFELLEVEFSDMDLTQIGFDIPGLDKWSEELNQRMSSKLEDDDFEVPVGGVETSIVEGDLIEIGDHKLLCGSSTEIESWSKLMGNDLADLVVTDPPYNIAYEGATKEKLTIKNDDMSDSDFYNFLLDFYVACNSFVKKGGAWYVWHADSEGANFRKAFKEAGILLKQCLIWVKSTFALGRQDYQWKHEPCLYGWKEGGAHYWKGGRKQTTVLEFDKPQRNGEHPTMKPIPLIGLQIGNSSKPGDIVCDGFGGSGTTMVAAHQMKRKCRMIELDPRYCQVIVDRMRKLDPTIEIKINGEIWDFEVEIPQ